MKWFLPIILLCAFFGLTPLSAELIDLENGIQDFVLYTKQLSIPGYPDAYNPSIIRWKGRLLLSFRDTPDPKQKYVSEIGVVWVNEEFAAISNPQILRFWSEEEYKKVPSRAEDGRLISVGEKLYLVYDDNRDPIITKGGFRVYITELNVIEDQIIPIGPEKIAYFDNESQNLREKAWTPFDYQNELLLLYSISPTRVFHYLRGTKSCKMIHQTFFPTDWKWGVLRGGTAASKLDDSCYLSFFHSCIEMTSVHSEGKVSLHYFMGAYTFSAEPPFNITAISPSPIVGKNFYHGKTYKPYHHPVCAVFPAGFICEGETIFVVYGRQDHEMWLMAIDKSGLLDSLKPV